MFSIVVKKGQANKVAKSIVIPNKIVAPVTMGDKIGYVEYRINNTLIGKSDIISAETVTKIDFIGLFVRILSKFLIK